MCLNFFGDGALRSDVQTTSVSTRPLLGSFRYDPPPLFELDAQRHELPSLLRRIKRRCRQGVGVEFPLMLHPIHTVVARNVPINKSRLPPTHIYHKITHYSI